MSDAIVWFKDYRIVPTEKASQDRAKQVFGSERVRLHCDDIGVVAKFTTSGGAVKEYRWSWDAIDTVVNVPREFSAKK